MSIKNISICFSLIVIIFIALALGAGRAIGLYDWFSWWVADAQPIVSEGVVTDVYEYSGRDRGKQRIFFSKSSGEKIVLYAVLEKNIVRQILDSGLDLHIRYYPTPTGRRYIYFIGSNEGLIYEGQFRRSGWAGGVIFVVCIFYCLIIFILSIILIKILTKRS